MGLFRLGQHDTRVRATHGGPGLGERLSQVAGILDVVLYEGYEDLEVVGESHYQEELWHLAGGRRNPEAQVRQEIFALLLAEPDNPYDSNAISVWIDGLKVGYLSRDDARQYRPGLLALQQKHGKPVALAGVIVGGGIRPDGPGRLGVFLRHDPADFGLA